jgi:hypothetical protein
MTIVIPKQLRSLEFTELTMVELNDIDIDRLMPHLWELIVKQGRLSAPPKDADDYDRYLDVLASSQCLQGFDDEQGRKVLDGWLRSSVVRIGAKGRGHVGSQMDYIQPLTIASYRAGLPKTRRHRHAHTLIYDLLIEQLRLRGAEQPEKTLGAELKKAVGEGVVIGPPSRWLPEYDGQTPVDINALLSLYFLEGFDPGGALNTPHSFKSSAVPAATSGLASDLLDYMAAYGGKLPPSAFIDRFAALISLRLFQLPLRLARSVRHVIKTGEQSSDMLDATARNPLELYCDFTTVRGSASDELARQAVQRDLEIMQGFGADRLLLRSLYQAMPNLRKRGEEIMSLSMADCLVAMLRERRDPMVSTYAIYSMQAIENETRDSAGGTDDDLDFISTVMESELLPIDQLTTLLLEGLATKGLQNQARWFSSTGGIKKPYGLITGAVISRRSWRYAPSDDLLQAILLVCFTAANGTRYLPRMPIARLLEILRDRFGILVDQPPASLNSADNRAAAAVNLEAFKRRLRLLGCFDGLSDDFSAQYVRNPLEIA